MSNIKELIRAEIERLKQHAEESKMEWVNEGYNQNAFAEDCRISSFDKLLSFLDTLPDESEQPTRGYDEAYLNEKIVKASKSWEGVDVDKFMDEVRGREPVSDCHDLEEAAEKYAEDEMMAGLAERAFKAGAEWMKKQIPTPEDTVLFQKGVEEGKRLMMEGAVEGTVIELGETYKDLSLSVNAKELNQVLQPLGVGDGNKVKIIIVKEEEQ